MNLTWQPASERPDLLADTVRKAIESDPALAAVVEVAEIDPAHSDTAVLVEQYSDVTLEDCGNCVLVSGKRGGEVSLAACLVLGATRADVNGVVRRHLNVRKASFAPLAEVEQATGMEYGGITPIGLPPEWQLLISEGVAAHPRVVIGSGVRRSKLRLPGAALTGTVLPGLALEI
ncbi:YbaK/EbsC family protein [Kineosporia succinea]|uniref:Prolyl-tRNA editing enzyme YbaK/EbsC (Cys-tRNA(Pro) deacylase) n=1 Tax=Kineosporia succinea TaxID=84632 RepID=A0ABT9P1A4_9ACTN|nr:YbaK/EbsC family protein [Kineosporia succinea]MDP9826443.1 prolyl-tRNA editing enzyme YbaK/EbsC (Cys-tRNA(Pro) deacylase) [Kineosporia succinea]